MIRSVSKILLFTLAFVLLDSSFAFAKNASVFEVRKNIPMFEGDEIFHDYYINAGAEDGLKVGMKITLSRSIPFRDTGSGHISEDLVVPVANVEIIHVQQSFSVARRLKVNTAKNQPIVDYNNVMLGDKIDLTALNNKAGSGNKSELENGPAESSKKSEVATANKLEFKNADLKMEAQTSAPSMDPNLYLPESKDKTETFDFASDEKLKVRPKVENNGPDLEFSRSPDEKQESLEFNPELGGLNLNSI